MQRLTAIIAFTAGLTPGLALAHGAHLPVPPAHHDAIHAAPLLGLTLIVVALVALWWKERRS